MSGNSPEEEQGESDLFGKIVTAIIKTTVRNDLSLLEESSSLLNNPQGVSF